MRDQTKKVMKDQLLAINTQIDNWTAQIAHLDGLVQAAKDERTRLRTERDLIKADLDAEGVVTEQVKAKAQAAPEVAELEEMLATEGVETGGDPGDAPGYDAASEEERAKAIEEASQAEPKEA